jgi:hypothetical protein
MGSGTKGGSNSEPPSGSSSGSSYGAGPGPGVSAQ